jgi:hypothetical protein
MHRIFVTLTLLIAGLAHAGSLPSFDQFPARVESRQAIPPLRFSDAESQHYRTVIAAAATQSVNFAGHYVLATWGCGAGCVMAAAIDKRSGRVTSLPFTVSDWPLNVTEPLAYRADSRLLVVSGRRNERGDAGPHDYLFDGRGFRLLGRGK